MLISEKKEEENKTRSIYYYKNKKDLSNQEFDCVRETEASCHRELFVKKLVTQLIYARKFSFLYCRLLT